MASVPAEGIPALFAVRPARDLIAAVTSAMPLVERQPARLLWVLSNAAPKSKPREDAAELGLITKEWNEGAEEAKSMLLGGA